MWRGIAARAGSVMVTVVGVASVVFLLLHLVPGDPVDVMLGESARPAQREALRAALGLDRPLLAQWLDWLAGLARGDLGDSLAAGAPVAGLLLERLPATVALAAAAAAVALALGLPLGVLAALTRGSAWDRTAIGVALLGAAVPAFWLGPLLVLVFALWLGWLPVSGADAPGALVLPALTLGTGMAAVLARMVRAALLEVLDEDWVRTARAKGLPPGRVVVAHALRVAAAPVVTLLGLQAGALLGGAVITETVFAWPGLGSLLVESIQRRDYPVVQACVLAVALAYVAANAAADAVCALLDPRLRGARG